MTAISEILESIESLPEDKRMEIDRIIREDIDAVPWRPLIDERNPYQATPQKMAYDSKADIVLFGGSAGGSKSSLIVGLALMEHKKTTIFRREITHLQPIIEEILKFRKTRKGFNSIIKRFDLGDNRTIRLGGMQYENDKKNFHGDARDLMAFDELEQFLESQFRYVITWNRSDDPGQRCRVVCTTNPPQDAQGDWIIAFWAPWLDPDHPNPAVPGELRFFISDKDGHDVEVDGPEPIEMDGDMVRPKSRTFIPSSVEDNPYLMNTGYKSTLQALPEPLRSQMLKGDFLAGRQDSAWQVIPTAWVEAAQDRWTENPPKNERMSALGVDPARGGADDMVLTPRYGNWIGRQIVKKGKEVPDGAFGSALCMQNVKHGAPIFLDIIGESGPSILDHLRTNGVNVVPVDGRKESFARDKSGSLGFFNKRSEMWWKVREALEPDNDNPIALPPDRELRADLCAPMWRLTSSGIQVEGKATECRDGFGDIKKRLGRSLNKGDSFVYCLLDGDKRHQSGQRRPKKTNSYKYNPLRRDN